MELLPMRSGKNGIALNMRSGMNGIAGGLYHTEPTHPNGYWLKPMLPTGVLMIW